MRIAKPPAPAPSSRVYARILLTGSNHRRDFVISWDGKLVEVVEDRAYSLDGLKRKDASIIYREGWLVALTPQENRIAMQLAATIIIRERYTEDQGELAKLIKMIEGKGGKKKWDRLFS